MYHEKNYTVICSRVWSLRFNLYKNNFQKITFNNKTS